MPKKYSELKADQRCIYQAFTKLTYVHDDATNMGNHVNGHGLDADDSNAVLKLADRYGMTECEVMHGTDVASGAAGFDKSKEFVVVITPHLNTQGAVQKVADGEGLTKGSSARKVLGDSPDGVAWHAIYGRTNDQGAMVWRDDQRINPNGPTGNTCAVVFYK